MQYPEKRFDSGFTDFISDPLFILASVVIFFSFVGYHLRRRLSFGKAALVLLVSGPVFAAVLAADVAQYLGRRAEPPTSMGEMLIMGLVYAALTGTSLGALRYMYRIGGEHGVATSGLAAKVEIFLIWMVVYMTTTGSLILSWLLRGAFERLTGA